MQTGMLDRLAAKGIVSRLVCLAIFVTGFAIVAALVGTLLFQADLKTSAIAWVACLLSALAAHVAGEFPKGDELIMARMAMQMAVRSAPPFLVAVWGIYFVEPPLEKSLVFYMILFYLVGLVADVQLSLARLKQVESS
jgi:hypothetical protein